MNWSTLLILLVGWLSAAQSANILALLPFPARSHHKIFQPVLEGLAKAGHQVTYFTAVPLSKPPPNLKQVEIGNVMEKMKHLMDDDGGGEDMVKKVFKWVSDNWCNYLVRIIGELSAELTLKEPAVQELIKDTKTKYDLIILETSFAQEIYAAFAHKYQAPIVEIIPASNLHWTYYIHGNPYDTSYIVDIDVNYSDHMTLRERIVNTAYSMLTRFAIINYFMPRVQAMADKHIRYPGWETRPPILDIVMNSSLLLMNSHEAVNYPYPLSPNVKLIGGINLQEKSQPLPKDIQTFMDGATDGVIYFTLGSHIEVSKTLGEELKNEFLKAFGKIKQRVLWKWETEFPNLPPNVKVSKWFPQQDILPHKNMRLFITHGGGLSLTETIYHGIPVIGIPILGDQPKNVNHAKVIGYGVHLALDNITEPAISWAINEVLTNPSYAKTVKERSAVLRDRVRTPQETAVYWVEYVLRHKGAHHLKPAVLFMPWYQQSLIDVYLVLTAIVVLPILLVFYITRAICRCICCRKSSAKAKSKRKKE